jgi:hypothetical protein
VKGQSAHLQEVHLHPDRLSNPGVRPPEDQHHQHQNQLLQIQNHQINLPQKREAEGNTGV